jgi:hypothetical protein
MAQQVGKNDSSTSTSLDMKTKSKKFSIGRGIAGIVGVCLILNLFTIACSNKAEEKGHPGWVSETIATDLENQVAIRDSVLSEMVLAFDKMDANLEIIRSKEAKIREWSANEEIPGKREDRMVRDIQVINTLMADNKDEIEKLRRRLNGSGVKIASLEERLDRMSVEINEKDRTLGELRQSLADREGMIQGLNDTLSKKDMILALHVALIQEQAAALYNKDAELHEAYFTSGSYRDLKARGLVEKKGALFGVLGGEKAMAANASPEGFTRIDQRAIVNIPVHGKNVELVTPHPTDSYEIHKDADGEVSTIDITDPESFWHNSKYLIVATDQ